MKKSSFPKWVMRAKFNISCIWCRLIAFWQCLDQAKFHDIWPTSRSILWTLYSCVSNVFPLKFQLSFAFCSQKQNGCDSFWKCSSNADRILQPEMRFQRTLICSLRTTSVEKSYESVTEVHIATMKKLENSNHEKTRNNLKTIEFQHLFWIGDDT
jgi:hypothetical protein